MTGEVEYLPVRAALETTLGSDHNLRSAKHAALVALCRVTADQVDAAGEDVSSRLIASYLSALKDLDRAMGGRSSSGRAGEGSSDGGKLGGLRAIAGGKS